MEILRTSSFWRDLKSILDYFDEVRADDVALSFLDALDATIDFIEEFPDLGNSWESSKPRHSGLRFRLVKGFEKHLVSHSAPLCRGQTEMPFLTCDSLYGARQRHKRASTANSAATDFAPRAGVRNMSLVLYRRDAEQVHVLRVIHASQDIESLLG